MSTAVELDPPREVFRGLRTPTLIVCCPPLLEVVGEPDVRRCQSDPNEFRLRECQRSTSAPIHFTRVNIGQKPPCEDFRTFYEELASRTVKTIAPVERHAWNAPSDPLGMPSDASE